MILGNTSGLCINYCSHRHDKIADKKNLMRDFFSLVILGWSLSWWGSHVGRGSWQLVHCICSQEAKSNAFWGSAHLLIFIQYETPTHEIVAPIFIMGLPTRVQYYRNVFVDCVKFILALFKSQSLPSYLVSVQTWHCNAYV